MGVPMVNMSITHCGAISYNITFTGGRGPNRRTVRWILHNADMNEAPSEATRVAGIVEQAGMSRVWTGATLTLGRAYRDDLIARPKTG